MPFASGTRVGPYEIDTPIGSGGMGEIYRARDTRLDRTVAIKVLSGALAADSESRQRFEHEARAIAALNDPHICTIHDVGRHGDHDYLVLEYLQGETLADRLQHGPELSLGEALAIAIQIGEALGRAHRAGIAHRDLKPANVMLVRRGGPSSAPHVKLLDFGVASRTAVPRQRSLDPALAGTMTSTLAATQLSAAPPSAGVSGTMQYMAPEQFDGEPGDHRADIFAFGCVLYEMLAGRKAFDGATALTVVAAIKNSAPPPIARVQTAHPLLDHVLRRCLDKDRERRWQDIGDVTGELRWIAENPIAALPAAAAVPPPSRARRIATAALIAAALGATAAAAWLGSQRARTGAADAPTLHLEISTAPSSDPSLAVSPDGTQIAFVANRDRIPQLWVRALDSTDNRVLTGTDGASFPFWSPDGRSIGFFAQEKLKRVDVAGGTPLVVADASNGRGGTWNADGVILFASAANGPILRVSTRGGPVEPVTQVSPTTGGDHRWPQFLPDGKRFLFSSILGTADTNGVYIASLDKTPAVRVVASEGAGRFAAPDRLLTIGQGALQAYAFDPESGRVQGQPAVVAQGFVRALSNSVFSNSDTGVLAYRVGAAQGRQLVWVNRQGTLVRAIGDPEGDFMASPELSADEQSVVVFRQRTGDNDIWVIELARNLERRVTDGLPADAHPLWDPDRQHVVFYSRRFSGGGLARQAAGGGPAEPLFPKNESGVPLSWTRDRQYLLVRRNTAPTGPDLVAIDVTAGQREVVVAHTKHDETEGQFSPDGKWVALVSSESGRPEVFVQSFPQAGGRTQVSRSGGTQVRWSPDGKEIFYIAPDGKMMSATIAPGAASPDVKPPVTLFQTHLATGTNVLGNKPQYAVSRDGLFLLNAASESPSAPIVVAVNWMKKLPK
jgi:eukaryotic-like serine/threonine-protein kinase